MTDQKIKAARLKAPIALIPLQALAGPARVFEYGARKYAPGNFLTATLTDGAGPRYASAAIRHLADMQLPNGLHTAESLAAIDPESGLPHIDHVICGMIMLRSILVKDGALPADPGLGNDPPGHIVIGHDPGAGASTAHDVRVGVRPDGSMVVLTDSRPVFSHWPMGGPAKDDPGYRGAAPRTAARESVRILIDETNAKNLPTPETIGQAVALLDHSRSRGGAHTLDWYGAHDLLGKISPTAVSCAYEAMARARAPLQTHFDNATAAIDLLRNRPVTVKGT